MQSKALTVQDYLDSLPEDRRVAIEAVRKTILKSLPKGIEEGMTYGMIGYYVPHSIYPQGYHCNPKMPLPFLNLGSQKNYMSLHLFCIYTASKQREAFINEYKATGKKLDMGAACLRFKKLEDLPLPLIGKHIKAMRVKEFIAGYEAVLSSSRKSKPAKPAAAKPKTSKTASKPVAKKPAVKSKPKR